MRRLYMLQIGIVLLTSVVLAQKDIKPPETFTASAQVLGNNAGSSAQVTIQINQYTSDKDRETIQEALRTGGYQGFYCFEWEKVWHPEILEPEVSFPQYAKVMREYLAAAGVTG